MLTQSEEKVEVRGWRKEIGSGENSNASHLVMEQQDLEREVQLASVHSAPELGNVSCPCLFSIPRVRQRTNKGPSCRAPTWCVQSHGFNFRHAK